MNLLPQKGYFCIHPLMHLFETILWIFGQISWRKFNHLRTCIQRAAHQSLVRCIFCILILIFFSCETNYLILYSDKFWCGETLVQLAQNGKNRQVKSAPNLVFYSLRQIKSAANLVIFSPRQIKSMAKKRFF